MANVKRKFDIKKTDFAIDGIYNYNVCVLISVDGGNNYYYCGIGRFVRTKKEARQWIKEYNKKAV